MCCRVFPSCLAGFERFFPTCTCFHLENFFVTCTNLSDTCEDVQITMITVVLLCVKVGSGAISECLICKIFLGKHTPSACLRMHINRLPLQSQMSSAAIELSAIMTTRQLCCVSVHMHIQKHLLSWSICS